jgi:DNA invertase Pin-like site-specific DNA recombinase
MHGGHMGETTRRKNTKLQELNKDGLIPALVVQSLYEDEGWSTVKIAKYFGITTTTVLRILEKYGVETRDYYGSKKRKQSAFKSVNIK